MKKMTHVIIILKYLRI